MSFWKGVAINVVSFLIIAIICFTGYHWYNMRFEARMNQFRDPARTTQTP